MNHLSSICLLCSCLLAFFSVPAVQAQEGVGSVQQQGEQVPARKVAVQERPVSVVLDDSLIQAELRPLILADSIVHSLDTIVQDQASVLLAPTDSIVSAPKLDMETNHWIPNPKKSLWMAIVFPGGGQIYNRKYWKLPIFYGGFIGCMYAINWNNTMYRDYSQAYIDITDDDPNSKSYENFIPRSYNIAANLERLQDIFRRKKDFYRRYRDMSVFCIIGVYALSIIDAYVDAELSSFDISSDLSMKVRPSVIHHQTALNTGNQLLSNSYGIQCSIMF